MSVQSPFITTPTIQPVTVPATPVTPVVTTSTPTQIVSTNENHQLIDMKKFQGLRGLIIFTFIIVLTALAFLLYLAVTDTEYRNNPTTGNPNENYQGINLAALVIGSVSVVLIFVLVGLTRMKRYEVPQQPQVIPGQTTTYRLAGQPNPQTSR